MSAIATEHVDRRAIVGVRVLDVLALATLATVGLTKFYWEPFGKLQLSDLLAAIFVTAWAADRIALGSSARRMDPRVMNAAAVLALWAGVMVLGYAGLGTELARGQFTKGFIAFGLHSAFLLGFAQHLCERGGRFARTSIRWFIAGFVVNAGWGLFQMAAWVGVQVDVDATFLSVLPFTGSDVGGIKNYGGGVYRINGLMRDTNHLGVALIAPICLAAGMLRGRQRVGAIVILASALILTLSRSGLVGLAMAVVVFTVLATPRLPIKRIIGWGLAAVVVIGGAVVALTALRPALARSLIFSRLDTSSGSTQTHLGLYELLPQIMADHPLVGIGVNGFALRFEQISGRVGFGPHSHFVRTLSETGVVGFALWLTIATLAITAVAKRGSLAGAGIAAALIGTWAGNLFYLTTHMLYVDMLMAFAFAAPATGILYNRRSMTHDANPRPQGSGASRSSNNRNRNRNRGGNGGGGRNQGQQRHQESVTVKQQSTVLSAIARKWWIVLISVVVVGGLAALGSSSTQSLYSATSSVYLGQPVAANGSLLNTVSSKAATAIEVATGDDAVGKAADDAGTSTSKVRSGLSVIPVTPPLASKLPSPPALIKIRAQMEKRDQAQSVASSLATTLVNESNSFIDGKIARLEARVKDLEASEKELTAQRSAALNQAGSASGADRAVWAALASGFSADIRSTRSELAAAESQLEVARELEMSKIVSKPRASKVTTSAGNSKLALGLLAGLVIGILIALLVDRAERRSRA